jgi:hypothetical protein
MKKIAVLILALVAVACKHGSDLPQPQVTISNIYAQWNLVKQTGGFTGSTIYTTPGTVYVQFSANNTVSWYQNNSLKSTGNFSVQLGKSIYSTDQKYILNFMGNGIDQSVMVAKKDTLVLADEAYDGYSSFYIRRK